MKTKTISLPTQAERREHARIERQLRHSEQSEESRSPLINHNIEDGPLIKKHRHSEQSEESRKISPPSEGDQGGGIPYLPDPLTKARHELQYYILHCYGCLIENEGIDEIEKLVVAIQTARLIDIPNYNMVGIANKLIEENEIDSSRRRGNVVRKHAIMKILRDKGGLGTSVIGNIFGNDHSTVVHATKKFSDDLVFYEDNKITYNKILNRFNQLIAEAQ